MYPAVGPRGKYSRHSPRATQLNRSGGGGREGADGTQTVAQIAPMDDDNCDKCMMGKYRML